MRFGKKSALPLKGTFLELVKESEDQDADKEGQWQENGDAGGEKLPENESGRNEEHHLDIKKDKEHGGDVELDGKTGGVGGGGGDPAFVGAVFDLVGKSFGPEDNAYADDDTAQGCSEQNLYKDGQIVDDFHIF